jgi:hypothetical protein
MCMCMFRGWFQQSKWRPCLRSVLLKSSVLLCVFVCVRMHMRVSVHVKGLNAKDIHKEMLPVYCWKCLLHKAVHNWVSDVLLWRRGWNGGAEVVLMTVKRLMCCGFHRTGKVMGQVYQCWWRVYWEINVFFQVGISHVLCLNPFVTYLLILPHS